MLKKFFDPITGALYLSDQIQAISKDVIKKCIEVNQEGFDVGQLEKPELRRQNAFFKEDRSVTFFSLNDNKLHAGNYDLTHFTNEDLVRNESVSLDI